MKTLKRIVSVTFIFFVIILSLLIAREPILRAIGSFLIVQDELKKSDVIVVLGGANGRVAEAARIYKQGFAQYIIMSGGCRDQRHNMARAMSRLAVRLDVPQDKIILEPEAMSTYQHPILVLPIMQQHKFESAIIVSSPYHMRRSSLLFNRAFKDSGIDLIYYPVQDSWFNTENWWTHSASRRMVKSEYAKLSINMWGKRVNEWVWKRLIEHEPSNESE